jgi:hypothetical protein
MGEISKTCSPALPGQHYKVLAGLRVTLTYGLERHQVTADLAASGPCECTLFHATGCAAGTWGTHLC